MNTETTFAAWEDMSILDQYQSIFWDMYKDAWGVRPRFVDTSSWTEEEYLKEFEYLDTIISRKEQIEKDIQEESITSFELLVTKTINMGAYTRENAIRWIIDDERDIGYVEYSHNLPYGYLKDYI